eukprot:TRINITY_DN42019_c0_g1_i1.p1 TRINITY_DN42019_c0_g1~~TRINITY_DN42019_c0_g1_i1.p1  ORF type:complete len:452 (+),score=75.95 TRINITY_DN42019_c0_g1_i1:74-1429(+)
MSDGATPETTSELATSETLGPRDKPVPDLLGAAGPDAVLNVGSSKDTPVPELLGAAARDEVLNPEPRSAAGPEDVLKGLGPTNKPVPELLGAAAPDDCDAASDDELLPGPEDPVARRASWLLLRILVACMVASAVFMLVLAVPIALDLYRKAHAPPQAPRMAPIVLPEGVEKVWLDVGTGSASSFEADLRFDNTSFLVALEPRPRAAVELTRRLLLEAEPNRSHRFAVLRRACGARGEARRVKMYVYPSEECSSLHKTNKHTAPIRCGAFEGFPPAEITVVAVTLQELLLALQRGPRIQLLKLDAQGHEWPCLEGAQEQLERVDNIFLEVQDLPSKHQKVVYDGSLNVEDFDNRLNKLNFIRQYCEFQNEELRELNCLYTRSGKSPVWVTRVPQQGRTRRGTSLEPRVDKKPPFAGVTYVEKLLTSEEPGEMNDLLMKFGFFRQPDWQLDR